MRDIKPASILLPLFQRMDFHLAVRAILEGEIQAQVWVDDPHRPASALLVNGRHAYLAGAQDNMDFNQALPARLLDGVRPLGEAQGLWGSVLYYDHPSWEPVIETLLADQRPRRIPRQYYAIEASPTVAPPTLPEGFTLRVADRGLLNDSDVLGLDDLRLEMVSERASIAEFLDKSFGICPIYENRLAGWCLSEYNCGERCEVGIATLPDFQRRGLAAAVTAAFIQLAWQRGIRHIGWHCYAGNQPSIATALRAGLHKVCDYQAYSLIASVDKS
ncbi:MAG: family N-acetyltransferase [Chloroflexi bacterium]|nr:family N-acetyltransferase [Chloroflexota bacterium]